MTPLLRTSTLLLATTLWVSPASAQDEPRIPRQKSQFHLFLLVGQSNMAGRGPLDDQATATHPRVWMLDQSGQWVPAVDPLHFDKPKVVGVGLGKTFALDYAERYPGVSVGLIPCAVGGSPIAAWEPGGFHSSTDTHPYDDAIPRAKLAMQSGVLKGILWHQGESDSNPKLAPIYEAKLQTLVARFRKDLGVEGVPFIVGQLGQFAERPWSDERKLVDAAHRRLPERVPNTAFASSDSLTHKGDQTHFDTKSYRELGHRFFQAYQRLIESGN